MHDDVRSSAQLDEKSEGQIGMQAVWPFVVQKGGRRPQVCPECNTPCDDKEHCNVNRKN